MAKPDNVAPMTVEVFHAWSAQRPGRYELFDGRPVAMAPERIGHVRMKARVWAALDRTIRERGLGCEALIDGAGVRIDETTLYIPDVMVRCGAPLGDDALEVADPVILVEIASPSTDGVDSGRKLADYFRLESLEHYLIVRTDARGVIHHARHHARQKGDAAILTRILTSGRIVLDPPGLAIALEELYGADGSGE